MAVNRKLLTGGGALLILAFACYTGLWFWMAGQIRTEMRAFIAEVQEDGVQILPRAMGVKGFPGRHAAWFSGRAAAEGVVIEVPLLEVRSIFMPGKPLAVEAPQGFSLAENAKADIWSLDRLLIETVIPASLPYDLTREDMTAWRDAGNVLTLEKIELQKNTLALEGSGTLMLDGNLQPSGAFEAHVTGHMDFLIWLQQNGHVETREAMLATAVLSGLSKTDPESSKNYMDVALTLQNQTLFVGPLPLVELPPVVWPWRSQPGLPR